MIRIKIIDKYIIRNYIKTFLFTALIFSLISVVIDISEKLDNFIRSQAAVSDVALHYYVHFIAFINGMLWPLFALISVIFFTSRLAKNSEIISILNAGVSFRRMIVPYMVAAGIVSGFHMLANHILIPLGSKIRIPFENQFIWQNTDESRTRHIHLMLDPQNKLYIRNYRQRDSTALDLRLESYNENAELVSFVEAKRAFWKGEPNHWQLKDYIVHTFEGTREHLENKIGAELDTTIDITPKDLTLVKNQQQFMTSSELREFLQKQRSRGIGGTRIFETELYRRTSEPISIFILTIIGMAVASRKTRGGLGLHLAIGISIGALFIVLSRFTMTFTNSESLGPVLGVWLPNIIFGTVALYLVRIAQK